MGLLSMKFDPIPTPALPLKGREKYSGALKLALMRAGGNQMNKNSPTKRDNIIALSAARDACPCWIPACVGMTG